MIKYLTNQIGDKGDLSGLGEPTNDPDLRAAKADGTG